MVRKRKINLIAITVLIFAIALTSAILTFDNRTALSLTSTDMSSATKVGNGNEFYNATEGKFDGTVTSDLMSKLFGSVSDPVAYIKDAGKNDYEKYKQGGVPYYVVPSKTINQNAGVDDKGLVIRLNGMDWMVASLTLADVGESDKEKDNVILTLYLANDFKNASTFTANSNNAKGNDVYSSSILRSDLLNLKNSTTDNFSDFRFFTQGDFAQQYIVQPKYIRYQEIESQYGRENPDAGQNVHLPNDAYGTLNYGVWGKVGYSPNEVFNSMGGVSAKYSDWKEDNIWIPSLTETGATNVMQNSSIWGLTDAQRKHNGNSAGAFVRSGFNVNYTAVYGILTDGSCFFRAPHTGTGTCGVRPAIHLNINSLLYLREPTTIETTYNGEEQNLETLKEEIDWYNAAFSDASMVKVNYSSTPKNAGTYTVTMTIQESAKDLVKWWDQDINPSLTRTTQLVIKQKPLSVNFDVSTSPPEAIPLNLCECDSALTDNLLKIRYTGRTGAIDYDSYDEPSQVGNYYAEVEIDTSIAGSANYKLDKTYKEPIVISTKQISLPKITNENGTSSWYTYNGTDQVYILTYDKNLMDITVVDQYIDKFSLNGEYIVVKNAGEYTNALKVSLKNAYNSVTGEGRNVWNTSNNDVTDKYLSFTVEKMELKLDFRTDDASGNINGPLGSSLSVMLVLNDGHTNYKPVGTDTVQIGITASRNGTGEPIKVYENLIIRQSSANTVSINLDISRIIAAGTYAVKIVADNPNYNVTLIRNINLVLKRSTQSPDLVWWLREDGIDTEFSKNAPIGSVDLVFDATNLVYNGKKYSFYVTAPFGYEITDDVVTVKNGTVLGLDWAIDAGEYISTVKIKKEGETNSVTYKLTWTIQKAKFDLSGVKWLNNGKVEYNDGQDVNPVIDPTTLPTGLLVNNYGGINVGSEIGKYGAVTVNFKLADGYEGNYELPSSGGKGTNYIFNGDGDFEWDKEWEIVPAVIALDWIEKQVQDINGTMFNVLVLKDPRVEGKIDYLYYETDSQGNIDTSKQPLTADQIEVSATARKYYKALPSIKSSYAGGYEFDGGEADYSGVFIVGGGATLITVSLEKNTFEYNGKPVAIKVIINGTATVGNLTFTYYKGDIVDEANKIDGVPVDAGNYVVVIGSNSGSVMIEGETQFEFTITRSKVSKEWKMGAKPPVLNLKYGQINGIEYEIIDGSGNVITDISQITAGTYKIRAKIKDSANYIFEDDTFETEYVEFTVREGDQLYDPTDPDNPNYPKEDDTDNPEPPTGGGDGGNVLDKIKDFFNKLIENNFPLWQVATSGVALLLTLIFMIKSIQYGNRKKKAKGEAKKYNAKTYAALLPIFSTQTVWLNLSNMIWSIIAFSLCGVMLLMFITMLITRKGWKKAELAKETAIEESEQRRFNSQNANQLALQEKIAQIGQVGGSTSNIEELLRQRDEAHRQEMAALREEQAKRDEAMKIMLANLMGRQQADSDIPYAAMDDTDLLVQKVIAGLLPAVQQMMPEATAYLAAPSEENEELKALVEEQNEEMRNMAAAHSEEMRAMTEKMCELQEQLSAMSQDRVEGVILPDQSEDIRALTERISELQEQLSQDRVEGILLPDNSEEIRNLEEKHSAEMQAMSAQMMSMQQKIEMMSSVAVDELDDDDLDDDEEEWDSILDEDDDDFVEAVIIEEDGTVKKTYPNFRMRLKQSSDKNREWYAAVKNLFCSQKGVTYRVYKRVEKIRYQGQVIAVIGIAKRSIKLWLALKPYEYDARRYHHKDVSDKPRFVDVPMYVRVSSDRALTRAQELILALFQELNMEARKRYNDRSIQELIFTLKHNKLLTNKQNKGLLCEVMHVHDCDVLSDELAEKCIESKNVESIDESYIETLKLDDIDAKFQDGNRVTLEKLKKVGLVSEECTGYTVTAGQRLTKPLIIVANDFKLSAVKMITLTGGRAIKLNKV